jgi:hypothetical protein
MYFILTHDFNIEDSQKGSVREVRGDSQEHKRKSEETVRRVQ